MTGEVTLPGRVLPIGGVKQKVLAAHRAGLREVILPLRNEADLDDVPEAVRDEMTFHPVDDVAKVLDLALEPAAVAAGAEPVAAADPGRRRARRRTGAWRLHAPPEAAPIDVQAGGPPSAVAARRGRGHPAAADRSRPCRR